MSKRLIPLLDRVLVQKVAAPEKSIGGVLLPETASKVHNAVNISYMLQEHDVHEHWTLEVTPEFQAVTEGDACVEMIDAASNLCAKLSDA